MEFTKQNSYLKEYLLKCPICYEQFGNIHKPLIIPCGHTICSLCVENLKKMSEEDYDEEYTSEFNDEEYDISLDTDENGVDEEDVSETDNDQSHEGSEEESESDDEENEIEEEEEENSIEVEEPIYPNMQEIIQPGDGGVLNQINGISEAQGVQPKPHFGENKSIKIKCSICRKKMKILENEIIVNKNVMDVVYSLETETEFNSGQETPSEKKKVEKKHYKIFCKICRFVDIEEHHLHRHTTHQSDFIYLNDENFNKMKNNILNPEKNTSESSISSSNELLSEKDDKISSTHIKPIHSNLFYYNSQIQEILSIFFEQLLKSQEFLIDSKIYFRDYFQVNSKAGYLKHKSFQKLTKLYNKFNKLIEEIEKIKESDNKHHQVVKKAEACLESAGILVSKYIKITEIYIHNYDKIFNSVKVEEKEVGEEDSVSKSKLHMSLVTDKLFLDKTIRILRNGFFETYFNRLIDSERRYATCLDNASNLIYIYDLRVENEVEKEYEKIFDYASVEGESEDIEVNFSDYVEIDDTGRYLYILGKRAKDSKTFRCYDLSLRTLEDKKKLPMKFGVFDRYYYSGKLFIIGGSKTDLTPIKECFYYDNEADWWVDLPILNLNRHSKSIACHNNKIYAFAGNAQDYHEDGCKFEVLDLESNIYPAAWKVFTVKKYNYFLTNIFYAFVGENLLTILGGEDFVSYEENQKGFLIHIDEKDYNNSEVIEEFKLKNTSLVNSYNIPSYYNGLIVGSRLGDGYFTKFNLRNNFKKLKHII